MGFSPIVAGASLISLNLQISQQQLSTVEFRFSYWNEVRTYLRGNVFTNFHKVCKNQFKKIHENS